MKTKIIHILAAAAILSVAAVGVGQAYAYFTTNTNADGAVEIKLGDITSITEAPVSEGNKTVTIHNSSDSGQAVWVRAKALAGTDIQESLTFSGENWSQSATKEDWSYYSIPVEPDAEVGESVNKAASGIGETYPLTVKVAVPKAVTGEEKFNVVIVYETKPAIKYADASGNTIYGEPDWDGAASEGGANS